MAKKISTQRRKGAKVPLIALISEERILQLSNDLSEGIRSGDAPEWRAVALYFRTLFDKQLQDFSAAQMSLSALSIAEEMRRSALLEIDEWLKHKNFRGLKRGGVQNP